jgi:hypothetical protein
VAIFVALALAGMMGIFTAGPTQTAEAQSSDATLSSLEITTADGNPVTLDPVFGPTVTNYEATGNNAVERGVRSVTVVATPNDDGASATVNGNDATTVDGATVPLPAPGLTNFSVLVTAADGMTERYYVTIERRKSSDADLSALSLTGSNGKAVGFQTSTTNDAAVEFSAGTAGYVAVVPRSITSVTVMADPNHTEANYKVTANVTNASGTAIEVGDDNVVELDDGTNANTGTTTFITVTVTAEDGTERATAYTITVTRSAVSTDNTLEKLEFRPGGQPTGFDPESNSIPGVGVITATVPSNVGYVTVTAVPKNDFASAVVKGGIRQTLEAPGENADGDPMDSTTTITVTVTPEAGPRSDGATTDDQIGTYTITVTRQAAANDNHLRSLSFTDDRHNEWEPKVTADPQAGEERDDLPFSPYEMAYWAEVGNSVEKVTVMAMTNVSGAKAVITEDGNGPDPDDMGVVTLDTTSDTTVITVTVTPEGGLDDEGNVPSDIDDATQETYAITVVKKEAADAGDDANLKSLMLSYGTLDPAFDASTTEYSASVLPSMGSVTITAEAMDKFALVQVNGAQVNAARQSTVTLGVGETTVVIKVTADNPNATMTYFVTITRDAASMDDTLSELNLWDGTEEVGDLATSFMASTTTYTATANNDVESVKVAYAPMSANVMVRP